MNNGDVRRQLAKRKADEVDREAVAVAKEHGDGAMNILRFIKSKAPYAAIFIIGMFLGYHTTCNAPVPRVLHEPNRQYEEGCESMRTRVVEWTFTERLPEEQIVTALLGTWYITAGFDSEANIKQQLERRCGITW